VTKDDTPIMETVFKDIHPIVRILAEESINGIFLVRKGKFIFVNANIALYTQYSVKELIRAKADSMIHPDDRERVKKEARRMLRGEHKVPYVYRIVTKQGHIRWVMETVSPFTIDGNRLLLGNTMDVTDRMEAEERLRRSENLYRTIFETTGTAMLIIEEDTTVSLVNTEFETIPNVKDPWNELIPHRSLSLGRQYRGRAIYDGCLLMNECKKSTAPF